MEAVPASAVFDAGEHNFAAAVVEASHDVPVLVDFWASWCGPCRTLGPLLERLATESHGAFRLAKVDTEREPRLAAMFQVRSIPFVVAFAGGKAVDAFVGALDEPGVRGFLERIGVVLGEPKLDRAAEPAALARATALLKTAARADLAEVRGILEGIEEEDDDYTRARRLLEAWPWFEGALDGEAAVAVQARAAREAWLRGEPELALETLLEAVRADRAWNDELARKATVALMQVHDELGPAIDALRRRLAVLLY